MVDGRVNGPLYKQLERFADVSKARLKVLAGRRSFNFDVIKDNKNTPRFK